MGKSQLYLNPRLEASVIERAHALFERQVLARGQQDRVGLLTSGTSGPSPRLVVLTQASLRASAQVVNARLEATSKDVWGLCLPEFHVGGLAIRERAALVGAQVRELCASAWNATEALQSMRSAGISLLSLVPTQLHDLLELGQAAPSTLRWVLIGGDRLPLALAASARRLGWPILPSYGMTEASSTIAVARGPDDHQLVVLPHVEVRRTATGFLQIRSSALFEASYRLSDEQRLCPDEEGWFTSADLVEISLGGSASERVLEVEGRGDDIVKINAEIVHLARLRELWREILSTKTLANESVGHGPTSQVGSTTWLTWLPDARRGAEVILVIEPATDRATVDSLLRTWNARVLPYERVSRVMVVPSLPKGSLGKVQDSRLREILLEQLREF